jgi:DNA-binding HxlR family transcriptional regulator
MSVEADAAAVNVRDRLLSDVSQPDVPSDPVPMTTNCKAREVVGRIGSKWAIYVISSLDDHTMRFGDLKRTIDGISQRMLTVTLRSLERDGLIRRTVYPVVPPRVEYALTPLGATLLEVVSTMVHWTDEHMREIDSAQLAYDSRPDPEPVEQ